LEREIEKEFEENRKQTYKKKVLGGTEYVARKN
jgi:hypothetical protein